jgi:predicted esterase
MSHMGNYKIVTTITEMGPYVSKLILQMPYEVYAAEVSKNSFNIYVERKECDTNEIVVSKNFLTQQESICKGYQIPRNVYPCNEAGTYQNQASFIALELSEETLGKRIEGDIMASRYINNAYRITQLHSFGNDPMKTGLVFDTCTEEICPQLTGWQIQKYPEGDTRLNYGYFAPQTEEQVPLIIWLHGAGEGGSDPRITISANKVSYLSSSDIQPFFGGAAYVLTPQCPTVWMDDGVEKLGKSNQSIYVKPLKACIDAFIEAHSDTIDRSRIYVGGMSNGGFMTMRMIFDYPDFFAGALPACEVFYSANITEEMLNSIKHIPTWFVHCKKDELVPPRETSLPTYFRLKEAGAENVHFTYYEILLDTTGRYKDELGQPRKMFNHAVWNNILNNECHTELDGTNVCVNGEPMTIWEWMANQRK